MSRHVRSRPTVPALVTAATLLLGGCSGSSADSAVEESERKSKSTTTEPGGPQAGPGASAAPSAKPATLEELAEAVGCKKAEEAGKAKDYRQGVCETAGAQYLLLTFDTLTGQREWLGISQMYGGVYLVGNRWVLSASPRSAMEAARDKLGGTIEENSAYGASPSAA
ncbi:hypothetical protein ACQPXS_35550 [Streptomyces sp. CA-142005]|uniref:hypothetical protein n=1 Tax=Streptomyces sp. CA-142005 TaxID=3240052 RepID=UPI003D928905